MSMKIARMTTPNRRDGAAGAHERSRHGSQPTRDQAVLAASDGLAPADYRNLPRSAYPRLARIVAVEVRSAKWKGGAVFDDNNRSRTRSAGRRRGEQFLYMSRQYGLHQVTIEASLCSPAAVVLLSPTRRRHEQQILAPGLRANSPRCVKAAHPRHAQVHEDKLWAKLVRHGERFNAVAGLANVVPDGSTSNHGPSAPRTSSGCMARAEKATG